jgi:TolB-like protein/tetratricopeptide (TPR) repeat protein
VSGSDTRAVRALQACDRVLELPVDERLPYVRQHFAGEPELARELESLVAAAEDAEHGLLGRSAEVLLQPVLADLEAEVSSSEAAFVAQVAAAVQPRYTVQEAVGRGGAARVFLAYDSSMRRFVALKVLLPELSDGLTRDRFELEIEIAARLDHPRIVPVYDRGEAGGLLFYAMRYGSRGSLRDRLRDHTREPRRLDIREAINIAREVAQAIDYAHSRGVVHRDIKPENILLDDGGAYVADFGIARLLDAVGRDHLTRTGIAIGTAHYMSPEQIESSRSVDGRSDVYSLGCVLFEMLAGEPPYTGPTRGDVLAKHLAAPIPDLSVVRRTVTPSMQEVMAKALAKTPADRYTMATEFVDAFESAYRAGDAPKGKARVAVLRPWRRPRVIGAVAASVAVPAVYLLWSVMRPPQPDSAASRPSAPTADRIAVLYFEDLSPDRRLGHIAAGLTEDLIDQLSQVPLLRVVSSNGVRLFKDSIVSVDTIRERLGVGTIIGGSVSSSGAMLRVSVRLIDAASGNQVNSMSVRQPLLNLFTLQDTVVGDVAFWLRERIGRQIRLEKPAPGQSVQAWELVQRGEELARVGSVRVLRGDTTALSFFLDADELFATAAKLDRSWLRPRVARARAALYRAFAYPRDSGHAHEFVGALRLAITLADSVLRQRPSTAEARAIRGESRLRLATLVRNQPSDSLLSLAASDLEASIRARPDQARSWYALAEVRRHNGEHAQAAEAYRTAYEHDPFLDDARAILSALFFSMLAAGEHGQAAEWCGVAQRRFSGDPRFVECQLHVIGSAGRTRHAVDSAWRLVQSTEAALPQAMVDQLWSWRRLLVAAVAARSRLPDSARVIIARVQAERGARPGAELPLAYVHVLLNDREQALHVLARYLESNSGRRSFVATHAWFNALTQEPQFRRLVEHNQRR